MSFLTPNKLHIKCRTRQHVIETERENRIDKIFCKNNQISLKTQKKCRRRKRNKNREDIKRHQEKHAQRHRKTLAQRKQKKVLTRILKNSMRKN